MPDGRWYVSAAHGETEIARTIDLVQKVFVQNKAKLIPVTSS